MGKNGGWCGDSEMFGGLAKVFAQRDGRISINGWYRSKMEAYLVYWTQPTVVGFNGGWTEPGTSPSDVVKDVSRRCSGI